MHNLKNYINLLKNFKNTFNIVYRLSEHNYRNREWHFRTLYRTYCYCRDLYCLNVSIVKKNTNKPREFERCSIRS